MLREQKTKWGEKKIGIYTVGSHFKIHSLPYIFAWKKDTMQLFSDILSDIRKFINENRKAIKSSGKLRIFWIQKKIGILQKFKKFLCFISLKLSDIWGQKLQKLLYHNCNT